MADDRNKKGLRDRNKVSSEQDYEIRHFAKQNGISEDQARELIKIFGNDRDALGREAQKLKK